MRNIAVSVRSTVWIHALACVVALGACVGDDPAASGNGTDAGAPDVSTDADQSQDAGGTDAGCAVGLTRCADTCVALDTSKDHCGRCGHDCGGGDCTSGACAPVELVSNYMGNNKNLAASDGTYFLTIGTEVRACSDVGCTKPVAIATFTDYPLQDGLAAGGGRVMFAASPNNPVSQTQGLYSCVDAGCVSLPGDTVIAAGKFIAVTGVEVGGSAHDRLAFGYENNGTKFIGTSKCTAASCTSPIVFSGLLPTPVTAFVAADDTNVYFTHVDTGATKLAMCPVAGCGGTTATVVGDLGITAGYSVRALRASGGLVYAAILGTTPRVSRCQPTGGGGCSVFATGIASYSAFDLDESGFYYGADFQGAVEMCKLTGCGGGPTRLRQPVLTGTAPTYDALRVSGRYIYWTQTLGGTKSVWRLAKP